MAMTKEHPLGEPTPAGRMRDALHTADEVAERVQKLRDKLLGERPKLDEGVASQLPRSFFEGREGRMNGLAAHADRFLDAAQRASNAIHEIEEALDVMDAKAVVGATAQSARMVGGARHD